MTQQSIVKLFGDRWNPGMGSSFGEQLHENIKAALTELRMNQILLRRITAAYEAEKKPPAAPPPPAARDLPDCLATKSPALVALNLAADGAIGWPAKPTRAFLSNVVAYLNSVTDADKVDFCRRLGVVLKARRDTRCWPSKNGAPVDAVSLFFNKPMFNQLANAAGKVQ